MIRIDTQNSYFLVKAEFIDETTNILSPTLVESLKK